MTVATKPRKNRPSKSEKALKSKVAPLSSVEAAKALLDASGLTVVEDVIGTPNPKYYVDSLIDSEGFSVAWYEDNVWQAAEVVLKDKYGEENCLSFHVPSEDYCVPF